MSEAVTKPRRGRVPAKVVEPKAEVKPAIYARAAFQHKPTDGDMQAIIPRLVEPLALKAKGEGRALADGGITVTTSQQEDGNWHVLATLELFHG